MSFFLLFFLGVSEWLYLAPLLCNAFSFKVVKVMSFVLQQPIWKVTSTGMATHRSQGLRQSKCIRVILVPLPVFLFLCGVARSQSLWSGPVWVGQVTDVGYHWEGNNSGQRCGYEWAAVAGRHEAVPIHYRPQLISVGGSVSSVSSVGGPDRCNGYDTKSDNVVQSGVDWARKSNCFSVNMYFSETVTQLLTHLIGFYLRLHSWHQGWISRHQETSFKGNIASAARVFFYRY